MVVVEIDEVRVKKNSAIGVTFGKRGRYYFNFDGASGKISIVDTESEDFYDEPNFEGSVKDLIEALETKVSVPGPDVDTSKTATAF